MRRRQRVRLSAAEARRIALAAQGFDRPRAAGRPDGRHFARLIQNLGLLQLDFVNVLVPAHYLVAWSRLGPFDRSRFDAHVYGSGRYTEQWAHEASIVPVETWPRLAHRHRAWPARPGGPLAQVPGVERYLDEVLARVRVVGALSADALPAVPAPRRKPGDWHRSIPRRALEHHFGRGALTVQARKPNFQRIYDLPERVIPADVLAQGLTDDDARLQLLQHAVRALGVATLNDLADYFRMSPRVAAPVLDRLAAAGALAPVDVAGWGQPAYLDTAARIPRRIDGACLLSPFDPLVWYRPRTERLFGFHYRLEIYVPAARRRWGYYVLPFRLGECLAARVDLKAERRERRLKVRAAYLEEGADVQPTAVPLADELWQLAAWLDLDDITVRRHNAFSRQLATVVRKTG